MSLSATATPNLHALPISTPTHLPPSVAFVVAVALPNVGKVVIDRSVIPQTADVQGRFEQGALVVAMSILPLFCILFLARRWRAAEAIGWVIFAVLLLGVFAK